MSDDRQDKTATESCHNLRNTNSSVEQTEIGSHVTIALKGIGDKGKRHSKHGSPGTADEQERNELQILVVEERHHGKAYGTDNQANGISHLGILELGQQGCPYHRTDGLNGKEHSHPVAGSLEGLAGGIYTI